MTDPIDIIAAVCDQMNQNGLTNTPRVVRFEEFDLYRFRAQASDIEGVELEWVKQSGPGILGDDFTGTIAVPIDTERFFVIDYAT